MYVCMYVHRDKGTALYSIKHTMTETDLEQGHALVDHQVVGLDVGVHDAFLGQEGQPTQQLLRVGEHLRV